MPGGHSDHEALSVAVVESLMTPLYGFSQHVLTAAFVLESRSRQVEALAELDRGDMELWAPEVWRRRRLMVAE